MNSATTTRDEQIDDYIAAEYLNRDGEGYMTRRLLRMAEEAKGSGHKGAAEILEKAAREMAGWEIDNA